MALNAAAGLAHRRLLSGGPKAQIVADELAARGIDSDDIARWRLGAGWAENWQQGRYRGDHLASAWPTLDSAGRKVAALSMRRLSACDDAENAAPGGWSPPAKYCYVRGSKPGSALFGAHLMPDGAGFAVMPEGYACVLALTKAGIAAASGIGVTMTATQADIAAELCRSWLVVLDRDPGGPKLPQAQRIGRLLAARGCQVRIAFMRTVKDPSENIDEARAVIDDAMAGPETALPADTHTDRRSRWRWADVADVLAHVDLVELISQTVELRGLRGDCPWHGSQGAGLGTWLAVYEGDDGIWRWHCHSGPCGGGTAADWIALRDGIDRDAAISLLADNAGLPADPDAADRAARRARYEAGLRS